MKKALVRLAVVVAVLGLGAGTAGADPKPPKCPPGYVGNPCMPETTH